MGGSLNGYRLRGSHGDTIDPRQPLPVDSVEAQETSSVAPTLTYNGKAAAGAVSVSSVPLKPIIEALGSRVGSYWGQVQNRVYEAFSDKSPKKGDEWMTAVVETNGSAAVSIYNPKKNLEEMFESLTTTVKRFVVKVTDTSGGTLYGWVMGVAVSSDLYTFDIYNDRLTELNQNWVGTLADFDHTSLEKVELFFYNSSLSFGTGTCFIEEVNCPKEYSKSRKSQLEYAETLNDGQFFVDYMRGELFGPKADTTASEVVTYNVWASTAGGSAGPSANVNVEKIGGDTVPGTPIFDEDTAHTTGDAGQHMLAVRDDALAAKTSADGDYGSLSIDALGYLYSILRGYDSSSDSNKGFNVAPDWSHSQRSTHVLTNVPNATPDETVVVDLEGYQGCSFQVEKDGGTDTVVLTVFASNEGTASTDKRDDITTNGTTLAGGSLTGDAFIHTNKGFRGKAVSLKITTAGGNNDNDYTVRTYKW